MKNQQILRHLSTAVRGTRRDMGMTQQELATATGVTQQAIAMIEAAERLPSVPILLALARALEVKPGQLLPDSQ